MRSASHSRMPLATVSVCVNFTRLGARGGLLRVLGVDPRLDHSIFGPRTRVTIWTRPLWIVLTPPHIPYENACVTVSLSTMFTKVRLYWILQFVTQYSYHTTYDTRRQQQYQCTSGSYGGTVALPVRRRAHSRWWRVPESPVNSLLGIRLSLAESTRVEHAWER